jgi:hypothetical protein
VGSTKKGSNKGFNPLAGVRIGEAGNPGPRPEHKEAPRGEGKKVGTDLRPHTEGSPPSQTTFEQVKEVGKVLQPSDGKHHGERKEGSPQGGSEGVERTDKGLAEEMFWAPLSSSSWEGPQQPSEQPGRAHHYGIAKGTSSSKGTDGPYGSGRTPGGQQGRKTGSHAQAREGGGDLTQELTVSSALAQVLHFEEVEGTDKAREPNGATRGTQGKKERTRQEALESPDRQDLDSQETVIGQPEAPQEVGQSEREAIWKKGYGAAREVIRNFFLKIHRGGGDHEEAMGILKPIFKELMSTEERQQELWHSSGSIAEGPLTEERSNVTGHGHRQREGEPHVKEQRTQLHREFPAQETGNEDPAIPVSWNHRTDPTTGDHWATWE